MIEDTHTALIDAVHARAPGAGPERVLPVLQHCAHPNVFVTGRTGVVLKLAIDVAAQAAVGAEPHAAAVARRDAPSEIALQALGLAGGRKFSFPQPQQPAAIRAHPETSLVVRQQRSKIARGKQIVGERVEFSLAPSDETAAAGAYPQISVLIVRDDLHDGA